MDSQNKTLRDYAASTVRTVVPILVGIGLSWLGREVGITVSPDVQAVVTGGVIACYYAVVRAAELKWRWVGVLLGWAITPVYAPKPEAGGAERSEVAPNDLTAGA